MVNPCRICAEPVPWPHSRHVACTPRDMWITCDVCGYNLPGVVALIVHHADVSGHGSPCQSRIDRSARVVDIGAWRGAS